MWRRRPPASWDDDGVEAAETGWRWLFAMRALPLRLPTLPLDLQVRAGPVRVALVTSYLLRRVEYLLSPGGQLRAWTWLNLRVALVLLVPVVGRWPLIAALLPMAIASPTLVLAEAVVWSELAVAALVGVLQALLLLLAIQVAMVGIVG